MPTLTDKQALDFLSRLCPAGLSNLGLLAGACLSGILSYNQQLIRDSQTSAATRTLGHPTPTAPPDHSPPPRSSPWKIAGLRPFGFARETSHGPLRLPLAILLTCGRQSK